MLGCFKGKNRQISSVERKEDRLFIKSEFGTLRIEPKSENIARITFTVRDDFSTKVKPGVINHDVFSQWDYEDSENEVVVKLEKLILTIQKDNCEITFANETGEDLLNCLGSALDFEEFTTYRLSDDKQDVHKVATADGEKVVIKDAIKEETGKSFHIRMPLEFGDEALYGLGQNEEGYASLRGQRVYVHQANKKIAVPFFVSTKGYGVLVDTYSPSIFNDNLEGTYYYVEAAAELDFYFINGENPNGAIKGYRQLTGKAALLPKWAYGYIQSQERYETADEMVEIAKKTREHGLGIDCVVLDWCSWEDGMWGQKSFDRTRFEHPDKMVEKLHELNTHFMISVWPNMDEKTENYKEFSENKLLLPGCNIYDALRKEGRDLYWKQVNEGLFKYGVDAWWCDSSEPITPEWIHFVKPESSRMYDEFCNEMALHIDEEYTNSFCLYHAQALYDGQRGVTNDKRVVNLTRSGYTGQQRYATILWSGDIEAKWETYRKQMAAGLNFCASGLPYWTIDVGAFFVKNGAFWYWHGDYDNGTADNGYRELFARWYQWACFLPVFRVHGTDFRRELWEFGNDGEIFYESIKKTNQLRYSLMPYIYSEAGKVWLEDKSMIRALALDFAADKMVWNLTDQYMFGESIMVCPVTTPMYYEKNNVELVGVDKTRMVYLPQGCEWFDFYTKEKYEGGQWIKVFADIDTIPLFVKAGSIIPMAKPALSTSEVTEVTEYRVYSDGKAHYTMYTDAGDGYGYEKGEYNLVEISMDSQE